MSDQRPTKERDFGADPTEDVGPSGSEAGPTDCEQRATTLSMGEPPQDCEIPLRTELDESFPVEPIPMVLDSIDGMPVPVDELTSFAFAAPFSLDTICCIEDDRVYVEVFKDEYAADMPAALVQLLQASDREMFSKDGRQNARRQIQPGEVRTRWGRTVAGFHDPGMPQGYLGYILVRPQRERCIHYKRQVFANDDVPDPEALGHKILYRNCGARRSVGGALMSLRDEAVYACEYRVPADPATTEKYLDQPDRARLHQRAHLTHLPMFGLDRPPKKEAAYAEGRKG